MNKPASLRDLMASDAILVDLDASDKKSLLQLLSHHAAQALGLAEHTLFDVLWEREKLGTTGVGAGIAIPHGRVDGLPDVRGFFVRLKAAIGFDAVDHQPVDLVFLLLAPEDAGADHLHALATVSRTLRDSAFCDKLRKAKDKKALSALLDSVSTPDVAA